MSQSPAPSCRKTEGCARTLEPRQDCKPWTPGQLCLEWPPWVKAWPVASAGYLESILRREEKTKMAGPERTGDVTKRVWLRKLAVL